MARIGEKPAKAVQKPFLPDEFLLADRIDLL